MLIALDRSNVCSLYTMLRVVSTSLRSLCVLESLYRYRSTLSVSRCSVPSACLAHDLGAQAWNQSSTIWYASLLFLHFISHSSHFILTPAISPAPW